MSYDTIVPLAIGATSTSASLAPLVGTSVVQGKTTYYLVKTDTAAISAAANVCLKFKTGSAASFLVDAVTGAAALAGTVAGVPQLPTGVTAAPASSYLWVATYGPITATTAGAVAAGVGVATHSTAGAVDDTTVTFDTRIGYAPDAIGSATTGTIFLTLRA